MGDGGGGGGGADSHTAAGRNKNSLCPTAERNPVGRLQAGGLEGGVQLCLWKEPGVHRRRGVSFDSDEDFGSDLQQQQERCCCCWSDQTAPPYEKKGGCRIPFGTRGSAERALASPVSLSQPPPLGNIFS